MSHFTSQKPVKTGTPLKRLLKHGVCLKKNVDYQANQNNKFLHFVSSSQLSGSDIHSGDIHQSVYLQGTSLKTEKTVQVCRGLPLFFPFNE